MGARTPAQQDRPFSCHLHTVAALPWSAGSGSVKAPILSAVLFVTQPWAVSVEISQAEEPILVTFKIQSVFHGPRPGCVSSASIAQKLREAFLSTSHGDRTLQFVQHCLRPHLT